ncbi:MAG: acyltransferase [Microthrixaceae bacterium]|nr:acyltransferase [Microthrixaceae bacterium]
MTQALTESQSEPTVIRPTDGRGFRLDIEGMRGIAVAVVVLFHAEVKWFSGGFVGVDVFFVLSGFLITGLLLDERDRSETISLSKFYARRARRLLPASMAVFVATIFLAKWLMSPLDLVELGPQARWVALFGSNIWFSNHATDYLQPDVISPFQQYWSLAVEEQFYLVWPLLILVLSVGAKSVKMRLRRVAIGVSVVIAASFVSAVWLTSVRQPSAFFLLPPRAWELGAGALGAVALRFGFGLSTRIASKVGVLGAIAVVAPVFAYGASTKFPGWMALPPVLGTVGLLLAGSASTGPAGSGGTSDTSQPYVTRLLQAQPLRWLGRYSYSLYLWHWPLLVIPAAAAGRALSGRERALLVGLSVLAAVATFHLVEDRFRHLQFLARRASSSYAFGAVLVVIAVASSSALPTTQSIAESVSKSAAGGDSELSVSLAKAVAEAPQDQAVVYDNECHRPTETDENTVELNLAACTTGDTASAAAPTVMLIGDSHAAHWQPALSEIATEDGWRLSSLTRSSCPIVEVPVELESTKAHYLQCDLWRQKIFQLVEVVRPSLVVIGHRSSYYEEQVGVEAWDAALQNTVSRLSQFTKVLVLRDLPSAPNSVPKCILSNTADLDSCEFIVEDNDAAEAERERAVVEGVGGRYVDPTGIVCPDGTCEVIDGDFVVFSDSNHLTASYSRSIADELAVLIEPALGI